LALLAACVGLQIAQGVFLKDTAVGFVKALEFKHSLRVCNAFPNVAELDIFRGKEKLTNSPMPYKGCRDFTSPMKAGDKLEFKVGEASQGTFEVFDLPNNDAVLLLVIHRHDQSSTASAFESHVFANLKNAQVAIIDTYKGSAQSTPRIKDKATPSKTDKQPKEAPRSEELRYSSIVAVNPGIYEVDLDDKDGKVESTSELVAVESESYVVLRVGVEAKSGPSYPQELLVFPKSDPSGIHSGAAGRALMTVLLASIVGAIW
jgi:hypothetical protein